MRTTLRLWQHAFLTVFLLTALLPGALSAFEGELLEPDKAFAFQATTEGDVVRAEWTIADGYYMYRDRISFESATPGVELGEPRIPRGTLKNDEFFGEVETFRNSLVVEIPVKSQGKASSFELIAKSQGCADVGVCYPPHTQQARLQLAAADPLAALGRLGDSLGLGGEDDILDPDEAFVLTAEAVDGNTIVARWAIAERYYLYRDKFDFALVDANGVALASVDMPAGKTKHDEFFGTVQVYYDEAEARLDLRRSDTGAREVTLQAKYQGCAEAGICYPPMTKTIAIALPTGVAGTAVGSVATGDSAPPLSQQDSLAQSLASGTVLLTIATFFGLGLLLSFTPCVFPMIPILSSIIVGQGEGLTTRRAFTMSLVFVLAMAVTYTIAGVIAGMFGQNLQATFQNPWILGTFAAIFVLLALSMFGFYNLQMPSFLQSKLTEVSNRQKGGTLTGVAVMGFLSALIVGPCVAAPLMGALIYIGQTGDAVLGGAALFALSMGMGVPLLALGTSAGKLLPRAGAWMDTIKAVFGVLLIAVAIWMLERVLPVAVSMALWALLLIIAAVYMGALDTIKEGASGWRRLWKGVGLVMLVYGSLLLVGTAAGGRDVLQPLYGIGFVGGSAAGGASVSQGLEFRTIKTVADLEGEIRTASAQGQPVMLDFYADWCVECKRYERYTFADAGVQQALSGVRLLKADVTANDAADRELLRNFQLIGPPSILFFGVDGQERRGYRVVGYMDAGEFTQHVQQALR